MKHAVQIAFVVLVACAVLIECRPQTAAKAAAKKAPAAKAAAVKKQAAKKANTKTLADYLKDPKVTKLVGQVNAGYKVTPVDIINIAFDDFKTGAQTSDPALKAVSAALTKISKAISDSPNGKLTPAQTEALLDELAAALGKATGAKKENVNLFKGCMKASGDLDESVLQKTVGECMPKLGEGTPEGQAKLTKFAFGFLPQDVRKVLEGVDVKKVVNQLTDFAAGKGAGEGLQGLKGLFQSIVPAGAAQDALSDIFNKQLAG